MYQSKSIAFVVSIEGLMDGTRLFVGASVPPMDGAGDVVGEAVVAIPYKSSEVIKVFPKLSRFGRTVFKSFVSVTPNH